ncbi:MAG: bifunctional UDP-N-acetylglucosamine diphosphorylase/glucosamine-1-phosphate N-acetyltransferase GlmU [Deltaproteobacteria bacterium]|nr:bifunctional UDP-N-acetylglucosamine diphosphorylase/glucosamine-1-phosphate N-acetyltransferase GlmU [Deltaproteobacteria bacterium]
MPATGRKRQFVAVVLAAGKGVRFKSDGPKVLHEILGRPLAWYPIRLALDAGAARVICVVEPEAAAVRGRLDSEFGAGAITYAVQSERLGTAHALHCAAPAIPKDATKILVLYGADPMMTRGTIDALIGAGKKSDLAITTAVLENPTGYGRVIRDEKRSIASIVEERDAAAGQKKVREVNAGIYMMNAALAKDLLRKVGNRNAQKEYYLTDLVGWTVRRGLKTASVPITDPSELVGVNDRAELAVCAREMARRINLGHMKNGVTIAAPDCTWIGPEVKIGRDTVVMPGCVLLGKTSIGKNCVVEAHAVVRDCVVGDAAHVREFCHLERSIVGDRAVVGPFARMRPESVLDDEAHIGNFVEIKKTRMGRRSKANHLTYLGDAQIGSDVNVGAGTITCNYDGVGKYVTVIEDGVFVGSDTQFVAPVTIGKNAYIGAGSTITTDVPPDSLALSRVPQRVIPEGAKAKRERAKKG